MREITDKDLRQLFEDIIESARQEKLSEFSMRIYHLNEQVINEVCQEQRISYDVKILTDGRMFGHFHLT